MPPDWQWLASFQDWSLRLLMASMIKHFFYSLFSIISPLDVVVVVAEIVALQHDKHSTSLNNNNLNQEFFCCVC